MAKTATPSETGGYLGKVGDLLLDVGRARWIDVERGDEDRPQSDYTETKNSVQSGISTKQIAIGAAAVVAVLVVIKRLI
jgi:hypothetical protein